MVLRQPSDRPTGIAHRLRAGKRKECAHTESAPRNGFHCTEAVRDAAWVTLGKVGSKSVAACSGSCVKHTRTSGEDFLVVRPVCVAHARFLMVAFSYLYFLICAAKENRRYQIS